MNLTPASQLSVGTVSILLTAFIHAGPHEDVLVQFFDEILKGMSHHELFDRW
jgi:hypothetical protein